MKVVLIAVAISILSLTLIIYTVDYGEYNEYSNLAKNVCDISSQQSATLVQEIPLSKGIIKYKSTEIKKAIDYQIDYSFGTTNREYTASQKKAFTNNEITYDYILIESDGNLTEYNHNGILVNQKIITFPYVYIDSKTGYTRTLTDPTVIVRINLGAFENRFTTPIIRSSAYIEHEIK